LDNRLAGNEPFTQPHVNMVGPKNPTPAKTVANK
jgi:hypothetical protein